ncbi:MAG TPA: histone deacetylase family protein [Aestuariivirgaceae bacterium]|nr:histone deacetylase family protein [Aestuariivirgaceae bacterium]
MTTLLLTHPLCVEHQPPEGHPERPERIKIVDRILSTPSFDPLLREEAPVAGEAQILSAHADEHFQRLHQASPDEGLEQLDPDTWLSPRSFDAALRAAGSAVRAVDAVMRREAENAFCAVRPPGHHAESRRAMGFCLFNNAAIAAHHARAAYDAERVAVVDFDVHHGNGTQEIFWSDPELFYGSTHQMPLYPGTGDRTERGVGNIFNAPLRAGDGSQQFRDAMKTLILPALDDFAPDLLIISAGFDAHRDDPLASLELTEEDFVWATLYLMDAAHRHADGRVVSLLEGGYDLKALAASVAVHVQALMRGSGDGGRPLPEDDD